MKYLFTLLATCFVLGLSAQTSSDKASKFIDDQIELVKNGLASQNTMLAQNEELTQEDKLKLTEKLTLSQDQIVKIKKALVQNSKAISDLNNSNIAQLEKNERLTGLEAARDHIIYQSLTPAQQTAFKASRNK